MDDPLNQPVMHEDPRTEHVETIALELFEAPNRAPAFEEDIALAWERAQAAAQQVFGDRVRVEQIR